MVGGWAWDSFCEIEVVLVVFLGEIVGEEEFLCECDFGVLGGCLCDEVVDEV